MKTADANHLLTLADWFDMEQDKGRWPNTSREVQANLRRIAERLDAAITKPLVLATIEATPTKQDQNFTYVLHCPTLDKFVGSEDKAEINKLLSVIEALRQAAMKHLKMIG